MRRLFTVLAYTILAVGMTACHFGCQSAHPPDPTVQLTEAIDTFDGTINILSSAKRAGLIQPAWVQPIAQGYVAAKAAIAQMQANVSSNPTAFQAALNDFNAAIGALITYRQKVQPATQPTKGVLYERRRFAPALTAHPVGWYGSRNYDFQRTSRRTRPNDCRRNRRVTIRAV